MKKKRLTFNRRNDILNKLSHYNHYLKYKPVSTWDRYDKSNWNAIIRNTKYESWLKK